MSSHLRDRWPTRSICDSWARWATYTWSTPRRKLGSGDDDVSDGDMLRRERWYIWMCVCLFGWRCGLWCFGAYMGMSVLRNSVVLKLCGGLRWICAFLMWVLFSWCALCSLDVRCVFVMCVVFSWCVMCFLEVVLFDLLLDVVLFDLLVLFVLLCFSFSTGFLAFVKIIEPA